jgi:hypothetical protein
MGRRISACAIGLALAVATAPIGLGVARAAASGGACSWSTSASYSPSITAIGAALLPSITWTSRETCDFPLVSLTISSTLYNGGGGVGAGQPEEAAGSVGTCSKGRCVTATTSGELPVAVPESKQILVTRFVAVNRSGWATGEAGGECRATGAGHTVLSCIIPFTFYADPLAGATEGLLDGASTPLVGVSDSTQPLVQRVL